MWMMENCMQGTLYCCTTQGTHAASEGKCIAQPHRLSSREGLFLLRSESRGLPPLQEKHHFKTVQRRVDHKITQIKLIYSKITWAYHQNLRGWKQEKRNRKSVYKYTGFGAIFLHSNAIFY